MYQRYYRFHCDPFRLAPDPRFSYPHRSFAAALSHLREALAQEEGFALVVARPGTGKTTLTESFVQGLDEARYQVVQLNTTQVDATELLRLAAFGFGLEADGVERASLLHRLEHHWRRLQEEDRRALLIVDEAQGLDIEALEQLRLLSNLQHGGRALVQIFLVGQEQLHRLLDDPRLEQLQQRLVAVCRLEPVTLSELRDYVHHRLCVAGWRGDPAIEPAALVLMHRFSQGLPRYVNRLANRLLLHGALEQKHRLGATEMALVLLDLREELLTPVHERPGPEGSSDRDLLYAVAAGQTWRDMLSPAEAAFVQRTDFDPPPLLTETEAEKESVTETGAPPARHWLRWSAVAAGVVALALPLALLYEPIHATAHSLLPAETPDSPRATAAAARAPQSVPPAGDTAIAPAPPTPPPATQVETAPPAAFAPTVASAATQPASPAQTRTQTRAETFAAVEPDPEPRSTAPAANAETTPVEQLLAKAEQAIAEDRLTVPKQASAYHFLLQARALEPDHPEVNAALDRVAARYGVLARWWMERGNYAEAVRMLERGFDVRARHPDLHAVRRDMHARVLRSDHPSPFPAAFDEGDSESSNTLRAARSAPAADDSEAAQAPALLRRLKALLSGTPTITPDSTTE